MEIRKCMLCGREWEVFKQDIDIYPQCKSYKNSIKVIGQPPIPDFSVSTEKFEEGLQVMPESNWLD